jgi:AcrR family transcriptional regulator
MPLNTVDKRERLILSAKDLIHKQGFARTTLSDISENAGVPLGNVYYYFKTKDEIAEAVINHRIDQFMRQFVLWEKIPDPRERLIAFVQYVIDRKKELATHGCPVGSLCQELDKENTALSGKSGLVLKYQAFWVHKQVESFECRQDSIGLTTHFLSLLQGMALLANALKDPEIIEREGEALKLWVYQL